MDHIKDVIASQYAASLEMLRSAITACPDWMWGDLEPNNKFWHIAYHAVFFTHLYMSPSEADFIPWEGHRDESDSHGRAGVGH